MWIQSSVATSSYITRCLGYQIYQKRVIWTRVTAIADRRPWQSCGCSDTIGKAIDSVKLLEAVLWQWTHPDQSSRLTLCFLSLIITFTFNVYCNKIVCLTGQYLLKLYWLSEIYVGLKLKIGGSSFGLLNRKAYLVSYLSVRHRSCQYAALNF